jgi:gliding motility-associated-like protein
MRNYTTQRFCLLLALFGMGFMSPISAQNNLKVAFRDAASAPRNISVCEDTATVTVTVSTEGVASASRTGLTATLNLFKGVQFVSFNAAGSTAGVSLQSGTTFTLPDLSPTGTSSVNISYRIRVNCLYTDSLTRNDLLSVVDSWRFNYTLSGQSLSETDFSTEYRDQIKVPFFTTSLTNTAVGGVRVGQCFTRTILVNNSGLSGYVRSFTYTNTQGAGISVNAVRVNGQTLPVTKNPIFNAAGDTLITVVVPSSIFRQNTRGPINPADGDELFEPDETATIIEDYCVVSCDKPRSSLHAMAWGCDARLCNTISRNDIVRIGEGSVNVGFTPSGTSANVEGGYCVLGKIGGTFRNNGVEIDRGTASMFNLDLGIGLGDSMGLANNGYRITKLKIAGVTIPSLTVAILSINNHPLFATDPDGAGVGLADLDSDGFFDDLPINQSVAVEIEYEVTCGVSLSNRNNNCKNDFETAFNAQINYTDFCGRRNQIIRPRFFSPLNTNDLVENCTDPDCGTDSRPFSIEHLERRNVFNFGKDCGGQEQIWVRIKLPQGIEPIQDSMRLIRYTDLMPLLSMTQSNDTVLLKFDLRSAQFLNGDFRVKMGFRATCTAQPGLTAFPFDLAYVCPPCSCQHVWYCDTLEGPRVHYSQPPCAPNAAYTCPKGLRTTEFKAVRTTIGYTDRTYRTKKDPTTVNLKAAQACDIVQMTVKNVVGTAPLSDSLGIRISYENITYSAANRQSDIFFFQNATVRFVKGGQLFTCTLDSTKVRTIRTDSAKFVYIDLHSCFASLNLGTLSAGDSVNFIGNFSVNPDGPYKNTFEKLPHFRAYGYHTDGGVEFACDDYGETYRIGNPQAVFSFPNSSNMPKGCATTDLDYKILMINNGYYDIFGDEYRQSVGVDSITFEFDTAMLRSFDTRIFVSIPDHPTYNNAYYPLSNFTNSGFYKATFDTLRVVPSLNRIGSFAFNLRIRATPNCRSLTGSSTNNNNFLFKPKIYFRDRYYATEIGDGSCAPARRDSVRNGNITYTDPPALNFTPVTNLTTTTVGDTATWEVKLCNTSDKGNAGITFLDIVPTASVQNFRVVSLKDITNNARHKTLTIKPYGTNNRNFFGFMDGLTVATPANNLDSICNIVEIKAVVKDCGESKIDINTGWNCQRPTDTTWSPANYPPCRELTLQATASIEAPFLDANFINQSLNSTGICDTATYEILLRNTDLGTAFDVRTSLTIPSLGADLQVSSFEVAYPRSAAYQRVSASPTQVGTNRRGKIYEFANFTPLSSFLATNGLKGFNPTLPNDSNEVKIRFKVVHNCDFLSGSLIYFSFAGRSSCGTPSNNESGESLPIGIQGATLDTAKQFSVGLVSGRLVPGAESQVEIFVKNLVATPSDARDRINVKLPLGVRYKLNSAVGVKPSTWTPTGTNIRTIDGAQIVSWAQPAGLVLNDSAKIRFTVITDDTLTCNGGTRDIGVLTTAQREVLCRATATTCRVDIITTSDGEQFYSLPLTGDSVRLTVNLPNQNGFIRAVSGQEIRLTATGATSINWFNVELGRVISTENPLIFNAMVGEMTIRAEAAGSSCLVPASVKIITAVGDTAPPRIITTDLEIGCRDTFPLIFPTVTDDNDPRPMVTYRDSLVTYHPCGERLYRTWIAIDASGKSARAVQIITKTDLVAPVLTPNHVLLRNFRSSDTLTVNCTNVPIFKVNDVTATDDCAANPAKSFVDLAVRQGICSVDGYAVLMECDWRAIDDCGNVGIFKIFVKVTDDNAPTLQNIPADITVSADSIPAQPNNVFGRDLCSDNVRVNFRENRVDSIITRTWIATDNCGNATTLSQKITVRTVAGRDLTPPQYRPALSLLQNAQNGDTLGINCGSNLAKSLKVSDLAITDNLDPNPTVRFDSTVVNATNCQTAGFITQKTYTWTATDASNNSSTFRISLKITDGTPPVFANIPANITISATDTFPTSTPSVSDACSAVTTRDSLSSTLSGLDTLITKTQIATDACGNVARATWTILRRATNSGGGLRDTIPPTITAMDALLAGFNNGDSIPVGCQARTCLENTSVKITDNLPNPIVEFDSTVVNGNCQRDGFLMLKTYSWVAHDSANNRSVFKMTLKIQDNQAPIFDNIPANTTISATDILPSNTPSVLDDCTNITRDSNITVLVRGMDTIYVRNWIASDECGNVTAARQLVFREAVGSNGQKAKGSQRAQTIQLFENQSDTVCLFRSFTGSNGFTATVICNDSVTPAVTYTLLRGDTCVRLQGNSVGLSRICYVVCDTFGLCDTTILRVEVLLKPELPRAIDDVLSLKKGQSYTLPLAKNDSLKGRPITKIELMYPARFGTAAIVKTDTGWVLTYQPNPDFCSSTIKEELAYQLCTDGGCSRATVMITVVCDKISVKNGFSPNGDGINEVFFLDGLESYQNTQVTVFNRWGNHVFTTKDYKNDWKGTWNDEPVPDGTYFYVIQLENGERMTGYLQILR